MDAVVDVEQLEDEDTAVEGLVWPGVVVGSLNDFSLGEGTYLYEGWIRSSVIGRKVVKPRSEHMDGGTGKSEVSVSGAAVTKTPPPRPGCEVMGRVRKVQQSRVLVEVICVDQKPLQQNFKGHIRQSEVRYLDVDSVQTSACFKANDIIRAKVISDATNRGVLLSTQEADCGVIAATSVHGYPLTAVNWRAMQCKGTGVFEARKVAKPRSLTSPSPSSTTTTATVMVS